jgi:hypothetical protein
VFTSVGSLQVYPNPVVNGTLRISNSVLKAGDKVLIYSLSGSVVAVYEVTAGSETAINISQLASGVYVVKAGAYAAKVVVK